MKHLALFTAFLSISLAFAQNPQAYKLYRSDGSEANYQDFIDTALHAEVVFFGELHNNPISHWMQLRVTQDLFKKKKKKLVLGAEMFESDNQLLLDEYLDSTISERSFEQEARLWPNHETDYKPLLSFAKKNELRFIATNIPRRYANLIYRDGLESLEKLSVEAKSYIAPIPFKVDLTQPAYVEMMEMANGHGGENLPKAQASKDATMAHFILKNRTKKELFLHFNGAYHSDNNQGIAWYIEHYAPGTKVVSITTVSQADVSSLLEENKGKADFIICVPEDMTATH